MADRGRDRPSRSRSPSKGGTKPSKKEKKQAREKKKQEALRVLQTPDTDSSEEVAAGESHGSSTQLALPTDNQVLTAEFVNSLASSINELTRSVKDIHLGMQTMQKESKEQREQISAILGELKGMQASIATSNQQYKTDMDNLNKEIEEKMAELRANSGRPVSASAAAAASSSGGPSGALPPAASPSGPRPSHRPCRLWFKGFGEVLTTKALNAFTADAVARLPAEHRSNAKPGSPGFGAVAYVDFPVTASIATIKQHLTDLKLQHTLENGEKKNIRITNDVPIPVRYTSKILGELWQNVKNHIATLEEGSRPDPLQLNNSNGKLYLIRGSRPLLLFETTIDKDGHMHVTAKTDNLAKYKITTVLSDAWIADATAAAARLAPK
jgi:hypothetical protein